MSDKRAVRAATTGARMLVGALVAAACVAGTVLAVNAPLPGIVHEPANAEVTPLPGDTVLVCNGDVRAIGRDSANPLQQTSAGSPRFTTGSVGAEPETTSLSAGDLADAGEVRRLTGAPEDRTAPLIAATESVTLTTEDLTGFAAIPCREAATESWLIGGTVETGSSDLVVLTNPGAVPSSVTLTSYSEIPTTTTKIVPAGGQIAVPLASVATGATAPVVQVTATGSPVRAVLQTSLVRTLDPVGVDLVDTVAAPQRHPVIPAVQIVQDDGDGASSAVLRLLAPRGDTTATVTVRAIGSTSVASTFDVELEQGLPLEVGFSSLDPGMYSIQVDAEAAVLAAVREQDGGGPGSDYAWATPAPEFTDEVLVAVPAGPAAALYLTNDEDADATVVIEASDGGEPEELTVPAGSSIEVDVDPQTVYSVTTSGAVHAAVTMSTKGALATWPVWPPASGEKSIVVYP